jgi:hypothetical protein
MYYSVGIETVLRGGWQEFDSRQGQENFLLSTAYRPALGPTQPPIQWVPEAVSSGVNWPVSEADHSLPTSGEVQLYLHSPIRLYDFMLN